MKLTDFIVPEDIEMMKKYYTVRRKSRKFTPKEYKFCFNNRKGKVKDIFLRAGMIPNSKKRVASLTDITGKKKDMKEIEELAKFPAENPYPVFRISKDGTILFNNKSSEPLLKQW